MQSVKLFELTIVKPHSEIHANLPKLYQCATKFLTKIVLKSCSGLFYTLFHIGTALDLVYHSMIPTYAYCGPMQMSTDEALRKVFIISHQNLSIA